MNITAQIQKIIEIAIDEHDRNCMNNFDDCKKCQLLHENNLAAKVDEIHKISSAYHFNSQEVLTAISEICADA